MNGCQSALKSYSPTNVITAKVFNDSILVYIDYKKQLKVESIEDLRTLYSTELKNEFTFQPILDKMNILYYANPEDKLICFDIQNDSVNWIFSADNKIQNLVLTNNGLLLFSVRGKGIYALEATTGKEVYKLEDFTTECANFSKPWNYRFLYDKENLFLTDFKCSPLSRYDLSTGKFINDYFTTENGEVNRLSIIEQFNETLIYSYISSSEILFIDKESAVEQNRQDIPITLTYGSTTSKNKIYMLSDNTIYEISEDHSIKSIYQFSNTCSVNLNIFDDNIYFVDCDYNLIRIDLKTYKSKRIGKAPTRNLTCVFKIGDEINYIF